MKKVALAATALALALGSLIGCDSSGGRLQPLSGMGPPAAHKAAAGPHPMPGGSAAATSAP